MQKKAKLKTPISYYGGKQMMINQIIPKIPTHEVYIEPFFGGGAIFFAKEPSKAEVVNDINNRLITFYKVLKYDFDELEKLMDETFHSRAQHKEADILYKNGKDNIENPVTMAWAVWVQTNMSFSCTIGGGFGYDRKGKCALKNFNKKSNMTSIFSERMKNVTIENYDVLKVIKAYDSPTAFFYLDPPYVTAHQGHYAGYTAQDFRNLLDACANMQGKFLLSSYPEDILQEYIEKYGWKHEQHIKTLAVDGRRKENRTKIECLTWNY